MSEANKSTTKGEGSSDLLGGSEPSERTADARSGAGRRTSSLGGRRCPVCRGSGMAQPIGYYRPIKCWCCKGKGTGERAKRSGPPSACGEGREV